MAEASETLNPTKDVYIYQLAPNGNYGINENLLLSPISGQVSRLLYTFDVSGYTGVQVATATLELYCYVTAGNLVGKEIYVCECTESGWIEDEVTWNNQSTGSAWATAGGEFIATNQATATITAAPQGTWLSWGVKDLVNTAMCGEYDFDFLVKYAVETTNTAAYLATYSVNANSAYYPKLYLTFTIQSKTDGDYMASATLVEGTSLDSLAFSITLDDNSHAYVMSPMGWTKTDNCKFNKLIYRPVSQEIWGSRRDTGQVSKVNYGGDFDCADTTADDISSAYKTGFFNLGVLDEQNVYDPEQAEANKRLRAFFSEIKSEGDLTLTVYTENDSTGKTFTLSPATADNTTYNMVRTHLSRAIRGKYFALKVTNSSGDDFHFGEAGLKIKPRKTR